MSKYVWYEKIMLKKRLSIGKTTILLQIGRIRGEAENYSIQTLTVNDTGKVYGVTSFW